MAQLDILVSLAGLNQVLAGLGQLRSGLRGISRDPNAPGALAGAAGSLAPFIDATQLATRSLAGIAAAGKELLDQLQALSASMAASGGTGRDVGFLAAMGIANPAGASASFRSAMQTPFGRYAGMRAGVDPQQFLPPQLGTQNYAAGLRQFLQGLREMIQLGQREEALRLARMAGQEDQIQVLSASQQQWDRLTKSAEELGNTLEIVSQPMADLKAAWQAFTNTLIADLGLIFSQTLPMLTSAIDMMSDAVNRATVYFFQFVYAMEAAHLALTGHFAEALEAMKTAMDPGLIQGVIQSVQAATAAMNSSAQAQNKAATAMQQGQFGGGQRFRDAITGGWLNPSMDGWSFRMGAFGY